MVARHSAEKLTRSICGMTILVGLIPSLIVSPWFTIPVVVCSYPWRWLTSYLERRCNFETFHIIYYRRFSFHPYFLNHQHVFNFVDYICVCVCFLHFSECMFACLYSVQNSCRVLDCSSLYTCIYSIKHFPC